VGDHDVCVGGTVAEERYWINSSSPFHHFCTSTGRTGALVAVVIEMFSPQSCFLVLLPGEALESRDFPSIS
jgi:hypothetical protein